MYYLLFIAIDLKFAFESFLSVVRIRKKAILFPGFELWVKISVRVKEARLLNQIQARSESQFVWMQISLSILRILCVEPNAEVIKP